VALATLVAVTQSVDAAAPWRVRQVSARSLASGYAVDPLASESMRPAERSFLSKASETSRQQLRLAEVGVSQAGDAQVRSHAQQLVADYRTLTDGLEALIRRKGGIAGAPVGGTSENPQKLAEKAGSNFDREFVRISGQATDEALSLFEQVVSDSKDADVRDFASAQLPTLRAHRAAINELRKTFE
jgi:putative membrane protein